MATVAGAKRRYREYVTEFNKKFSAMKLEICQAKKPADRERIGEQMQELVDGFVKRIHKEEVLLNHTDSSRRNSQNRVTARPNLNRL